MARVCWAAVIDARFIASDRRLTACVRKGTDADNFELRSLSNPAISLAE